MPAADAAEPVSARNDQPLRVLVVEENPVNQAVAAAMLDALGYSCDLAAIGYEALAAIEQHRYELVLMDCQMPEMDGFEATRTLRRREVAFGARRLPVTAYALDGDREKCLAAGMDAYLPKPYSRAQLGEAGRQLIQH